MALTQERLKEVLHYDPQAGLFRWRARPVRQYRDKGINTRFAGKVAGHINKTTGYIDITIDLHPCQGHRLAFLYMTGTMPEEVDHINLNRSDNRWCNLRACTHGQNMTNVQRQKNNTSGFKGVSRRKDTNRYQAYIHHRRKKINLGCFDSPEEAHAVYCAKAEELRGPFFRSE